MSGTIVIIVIAVLLFFLLISKWEKLAFKGLDYKRSFDTYRAFPKEKVGFTMELTNKKILPLTWIEIESNIPPEMVIDRQRVAKSRSTGYLVHTVVLSLLWFQRIRRKYEVHFTKRGYYQLRGALIKTGDYFGVNSYEKNYEIPTDIIIYPNILPLEDIVTENKSFLGENIVKRWILDDPTYLSGVREYTPYDSLKTIHWSATAKTGQLQVRKNQYSSDTSIMYILSIQTSGVIWHGVDSQILERLIEIAASYIDDSEKKKIPYGLSTNSSIPHQQLGSTFIKPALGKAHFQNSFDILAKITTYRTASLQEIINQAMVRLPNTVIISIVTGYLDQQIIDSIINGKKKGFLFQITSTKDVLEKYPELNKLAKTFAIREEVKDKIEDYSAVT